jgi:hypothetical protein
MRRPEQALKLALFRLEPASDHDLWRLVLSGIIAFGKVICSASDVICSTSTCFVKASFPLHPVRPSVNVFRDAFEFLFQPSCLECHIYPLVSDFIRLFASTSC